MTEPTPRPADTLIREALLLELRREAEDADGRMTDKLQLIARKLIDKAVDGDLAATKEVYDRVAGKPQIPPRPEEPPAKVIFEWKSSGGCK